MRRIGLVALMVLVALAAVGLTRAQGDTYPLAFEYDESADEYFAVAELTLAEPVGSGAERVDRNQHTAGEKCSGAARPPLDRSM